MTIDRPALVAAIQKHQPTFVAGGCSDAYLVGRYDVLPQSFKTLTPDQIGQQPPVTGPTAVRQDSTHELHIRSGAGTAEGDRRFDAGSSDLIDPEKSRADMYERGATAWQRPIAAVDQGRVDAGEPEDDVEAARLAMREDNANAWKKQSA